ncbi:MAG: orotidine 5-phosphate decarboxylase [Thermoleophilia bacterium]|nr:orotidine 5-phosphate decarboxylase [Thermoleophilia bacterium]
MNDRDQHAPFEADVSTGGPLTTGDVITPAPGADPVPGAIDIPAVKAGRARASFAQRLERRAGGAAFALCAGLDPSPDALELLEHAAPAPGTPHRTSEAARIERFCGMVIEAVRDHAVAIKPQLAWFEQAGAPGMRTLDRVVAYARTANLLVILDGKRGDVPHSAAAYAEAWLGEDAASGIPGDALTINAAVGADALAAMATVAAVRHTALYALLVTSNPGAAALQAAPLADGRPWWHLLAGQLADADRIHGPGVVGAVVGATRPELLAEARALLPTSPLLAPGVGAQGGRAATLVGTSNPVSGIALPPTTLVPVSRSLLPTERAGTAGFRFAVGAAAAALAAELAPPGTETDPTVG